jgi:vitamin B12 transporter
VAAYGLTFARYDTDGILDFNNAHRNTVLNGRVDLDLDEASGVRITARALERSYGFPTDFSGAVVDTNQQTFFNEAQLGLEFTRRLSRRLDLRALVTVFDSETGTDDAPDGAADTLGYFGFQSLDALTRTQADLRLNWMLGARTVLSGGFEYEGQTLRSFNESLTQWGPSSGRSDYDRRNRAAYAHLATAVGSVSLNAGLRSEDNEQFGGFTTWQLGGSWAVAPSTRFRGSLGRGLKEPTFYEAFAQGFVTGNPNLRPERSTSWEFGVEQSMLGDRIDLQATWFDQRLRDLIQYTGASPEPGAPNYFNIAQARARGLELSAIARVSASLALRAEFTRFDTKVEDAGFDEGETANLVVGQPLLRRPDHQLRLALDWASDGPIGASLSALRVGERADRDFTAWPVAAVTLPAYTLLNGSLEARLLDASEGRPGVSLYLRAENLLDENYVEVFGFRTPGRALYVGGRVQVGG